MVEKLNEKFLASDQTIDKANLKNRMKMIKKECTMMKDYLRKVALDGMMRERWFMQSQVWREYTQAHPKFKSYIRKQLPDWNKLCMIFSKCVADGRQNLNPLDDNAFDATPLGDALDDFDREMPKGFQEGCVLGLDKVLPSQNNVGRASGTPSSSRASRGTIGQGIINAIQTFAETMQAYASQSAKYAKQSVEITKPSFIKKR